MQRLIERIESRAARVGVIGLGYVGLTVACALAAQRFKVTGVDLKADRVARINRGQCPIEGKEPELPELLAAGVSAGHLVAVDDVNALAGCDIVLINVETPIEADHLPRFAALKSACLGLGKILGDQALVIVESTLSPGTCVRVVAPLLEEASGKTLNAAKNGFYLGHCPERVMPGRLLKNLRELARVCGGSTPETARAMRALYATFVAGELDEADCTTAELVKTAENAYRDVNIAFANELAIICEHADADFLRVRTLVNKSPGRNVLMAGAGVGGHCIPKDPWLLASGAPPGTARLVAAARAVNDDMPAHVVGLTKDALTACARSLPDARVVVLGWAYLENSDDTRNSPSEALVEQLKAAGAVDVVVHDPWVPEFSRELWAAVDGADAVIVMVAHDAYKALDLPKLKAALRTPALIDGRQLVDLEQARALGFVVRAIGRAGVTTTTTTTTTATTTKMRMTS